MNQIEAKTIQKYICHELMNLRKNKNFKERDIALVLDIGITDLLEIEKGKIRLSHSLYICNYVIYITLN